MSTPERSELRNVFFDIWRKHRAQQPIEPLEAQLLAVILEHPEYHTLLEQPEHYATVDFGDANPFLHMSLHLSIREQISTNRPAGIQQEYERLLAGLKNPLAVEHKMMDCLEEILWQAQRDGVLPAEEIYLQRLQAL
jgi:hypothetical protein